MNVLVHDSAVFGDLITGSHRFSWGLARTLANAGHDVLFAAPDVAGKGVGETVQDGVRVHRYAYGKRNGGVGNWALLQDTASTLRSLARAQQPQAVWVHSSIGAAGYAISGVRLPCLWNMQGPGVDEERVRAERQSAMRRMAFIGGDIVSAWRSTRVLFASNFMRDYWLRLTRGAVPRSRLEVVPLATDAATIAAAAGPLNGAAGDRGSELRIAAVRRLDPRMGLDSLIEAVALLRARGVPASLRIAGQGSDRQRLERLAADRRVEPWVRLLGRVPDEEIIELYRTSHVAVVPTRSLEGFGLAAVEAMAAGVPTIATPVASLPEVVGVRFPDLLSAGSDPQALADAVARIAAMPEDQYMALRHAVAAYAQEFDWQRMLPRYEALLESVCAA
jgi:glycosyltransferase involved in cell wall biosynthesis